MSVESGEIATDGGCGYWGRRDERGWRPLPAAGAGLVGWQGAASIAQAAPWLGACAELSRPASLMLMHQWRGWDQWHEQNDWRVVERKLAAQRPCGCG